MVNKKYNAIRYIYIKQNVYISSFKYSYMNRIKEVLEEKGIKQVWLADKLGKSFNTVNGYVQNRTQPSLEILYEIAKILNVDPKELLVNVELT
jgi:transcriptional regulator with XRE-family HTH domain